MTSVHIPRGVQIGEHLAENVIEEAWKGHDEHGDRNVGLAPHLLSAEVLDELIGGLWYFRQIADHLQRGPAGQERIYLSGPYSDEDKQRRDLNILRARECAGICLRRGHWPFCPHTMTGCFEDFFPDLPWMTYIAADLAWLPFCHSMLMLPEWEESKGACIERDRARALRLTIYEDISEVPDLRAKIKELQE